MGRAHLPFLSFARSLSPSALALGILSAPFALGLVLIVGRAVLTAYYGGGASSFDQQHEMRIAQRVEAASSREEAFRLLAENWQPDSPWRREILASDGAPQDLCIAEANQTPDRRGLLMIACGNIDSFRPVAFSTARQPYLDDEMRERALWAIERALRMSGERYRELGVVAVYQSLPMTDENQAVYFAALQLPKRVPSKADLLATLDERLIVKENTAARRRSPIGFR